MAEDEAIEALASELMDKSDDEIMSALDNFGIEADDAEDLLALVHEIRDDEAENETEATGNSDEELAKRLAAIMAEDENANVSIEKVDKDDDGDLDSISITESPNSNDSTSADDTENSSMAEDKPHDDSESATNSTNEFANILSNYKW